MEQKQSLEELLKTLPPAERQRLEEKQQKMLDDAQRHIAIYKEKGQKALEEAIENEMDNFTT
jgi:mRNA-degrading endonuclease RelE of RelBE toxin-antitoxin system